MKKEHLWTLLQILVICLTVERLEVNILCMKEHRTLLQLLLFCFIERPGSDYSIYERTLNIGCFFLTVINAFSFERPGSDYSIYKRTLSRTLLQLLMIFFSKTWKWFMKEYCFFYVDVPSPPGRPILEDIRSRQMTISWLPSDYENNSPVTNYTVLFRYWVHLSAK